MVPKLVGVGGGTGSGKTTLCKNVKKEMGDLLCLISLDNYFYKDSESHNRPESINVNKFLEDLDKLMEGDKDTTVLQKEQEYKTRPIIMIEGHLTLSFSEIFQQLDLSIYVDMDLEERVLRRLERDMEWRDDFKSITSWYRNDVKENHREFIKPTKEKADLIIWGEINQRRVTVLENILRGLIN